MSDINEPDPQLWTRCDSLSDLQSRLRGTKKRVSKTIQTNDASAWGYLEFPTFAVPIGFADLGIKPQSASLGSLTIIGINELITGISNSTGEHAFEYRMPTVFYDFLCADARGVLAADEIGFVWITLDGQEQWKHVAADTLENYTFSDNIIAGNYMGGDTFKIEVPEFPL